MKWKIAVNMLLIYNFVWEHHQVHVSNSVYFDSNDDDNIPVFPKSLGRVGSVRAETRATG